MTMITSAQKDILRTREAAAMLKVTTQTIKNYIYSGRLKALKTPGGHHRIRKADLKALGFLDELLNSYSATIRVILKALDTRDTITPGHSQRVAEYSGELAQRLGLSPEEKRNLDLAALLHDVGKIGMSEYVLGKRGKLTEQELYMIKKHPEFGENLLKNIAFLKSTLPSIRHHHERFDGKGYPNQLQGEEIRYPHAL